MIDETQLRQRKRKRLWLALAALAVILAVVFVPPFVSVSRYKSRIAQLISASLGHPVRISSVEVRLLPRPGFLLTDLTVEENPAYGAEPVLHANSVTASIRLLSLWRGRLEIDTISVDEASLNLVRIPDGRWNLDSLLLPATSQRQSETGGAGPGKPKKPFKLPYLEATNSRINIMSGVEKLPFSLLDADLSFWQQSPGDWRLRLRGQPVRTDLSLEEGDTGVVRIEAELRRAPQLRQMPVHLDLEWRQAQLGQLTRLLFGSDAGWRGDLTGELHMDGTADAAQLQTRLRATGVHRAEFAPAEPMDFDANCTLVAHFSARAIDNLVCNSPLGDGHIRLTGNLPGNLAAQGDQTRFSAELDHVPVAIGLEALRTVRSGLAPSLVAAGSATGKLIYSPNTENNTAPNRVPPKPSVRHGHARSAKAPPAERAAIQGPLTGSIVIEGFQLSSNGLSTPIRVAKVLLEPAPVMANPEPGESQALAATVAIPSGGESPLTVSTRLALSGYWVSLRGQTSIGRVRELAQMAGFANTGILDALAGDPVTLELTADGPWMPIPPPLLAFSSGGATPAAAADKLTGTVTLRNANWKAGYLASHVVISQATLHLAADQLSWNPVVFSYGPLKGTATLSLPTVCSEPEPCAPQFEVQFGALDAAVIQTAILGAHERSTLLSTLIDRLRFSTPPTWPRLEGTVKAESLILGPVTLHEPAATIETLANGAKITAFDAALLGGRVQGTGTLHTAASAQDKPSYDFEGQFEKLSPQTVGELLGLRFSGGVFGGNGKIELAGYTGKDLAASANGTLHFAWQHGTVAASPGASLLPPTLAHFDLWTADAGIANGLLRLKDNRVKRGARTVSIQATVTLALPPKSAVSAPKTVRAKR